MKRLGIYLLALLLLLSGCTAGKDTPAPEPRSIEPAETAGSAEAGPDWFSGTLDEMIHSEDYRKNGMGYALQDVTGDGAPELLVGETRDGCLYGIYTREGSSARQILEGWERNRWYLTPDGLYNVGSNGAMYTIFGSFSLTPQGETVCRDYYFTYETDETLSEIGFYHNSTGQWDREASQRLDITEAEFWDIQQAMEGLILIPDLTPLSAWRGLTAEFTENPADYPVESGEVPIRLTALDSLTGLCILKLTPEDSGYDIGFSGQPVCVLPDLAAGTDVTIGLSFPGDLPLWAISFRDSAGNPRLYALEISGENGSLLLMDIHLTNDITSTI